MLKVYWDRSKMSKKQYVARRGVCSTKMKIGMLHVVVGTDFVRTGGGGTEHRVREGGRAVFAGEG